MIIRKYGIELHRLKLGDIELVRKHRNSKYIRSKMFFQKIISKQEQLDWFHSINNNRNFYFIIKHKEEKVGLVHGRICSKDEEKAEGGIFLWDKKAMETHLPVAVSLCMADLTFSILKLKATVATVRDDNTRVIQYNQMLGYEISERLPGAHKVVMELNAAQYFEKTKKIRKAMGILTGDDKILAPSDIELPDSAKHWYALAEKDPKAFLEIF